MLACSFESPAFFKATAKTSCALAPFPLLTSSAASRMGLSIGGMRWPNRFMASTTIASKQRYALEQRLIIFVISQFAAGCPLCIVKERVENQALWQGRLRLW